MIRSKTLAACVLALAASAPATAFAEDADKPTPASSDRPLGADATSSIQLNPTFLKTSVGVHYRHVIRRDDEGPRSHFEAGAGLAATPSYVSPSVHAELRFARTFALRAEYAYVGYTSHSRGLVTFASAKADFSEDVLERREASSGATHRVTLTPNGQVTLGPLLIKAKNDISYLRTTEAGEAFYVPDYDTLVRSDDVVLASRTDGLFTVWRGAGDAGFRLGPSLQSTWAVRSNLQRMRAGATFGFTPAESVAFFLRPTIAVDVGINVTDEHRAGQAYGALALSSEL